MKGSVQNISRKSGNTKCRSKSPKAEIPGENTTQHRVRTGLVWCSDVFGNHERIHFVNWPGSRHEVVGLDIGENIL